MCVYVVPAFNLGINCRYSGSIAQLYLLINLIKSYSVIVGIKHLCDMKKDKNSICIYINYIYTKK